MMRRVLIIRAAAMTPVDRVQAVAATVWRRLRGQLVFR